MPKITIADLEKIREDTKRTLNFRLGTCKAKITVHMGTCGIAAGARAVMDALMNEIAEAAAKDIMVATSGCAGMCKEEPMITIEILGEEPIVYRQMDASRVRQVFKQHVLEGEVQTVFAIPKG